MAQDLAVHVDEHIAECEVDLEVIQFKRLSVSTESGRALVGRESKTDHIRRDQVGRVARVC